MPLAIELDGARLRTMSVDQLASRLEDRRRLRLRHLALPLALNRPGGGPPRERPVPGYRRETSSATMSAAGCVWRASATPCPAHIESASMSPVVPVIGGAGS
jgi:hypothetical protein